MATKKQAGATGKPKATRPATAVGDAALRPHRAGAVGFAALPPEKRRELAKRGGAAAVRNGTQHRPTREQQVAGGRKGAALSIKKRLGL